MTHTKSFMSIPCPNRTTSRLEVPAQPINEVAIVPSKMHPAQMRSGHEEAVASLHSSSQSTTLSGDLYWSWLLDSHLI